MEYIKLRKKQATTDNEERMLQRVAEAAANTLTAIETHSICVLLSIAFGAGTMQSRIFARHVNALRQKLGLPQITQAAPGDPTTEGKMKILQTARFRSLKLNFGPIWLGSIASTLMDERIRSLRQTSTLPYTDWRIAFPKASCGPTNE